MDETALIRAAEAFSLPRYREAHRAYHNEAHIRSMLADLSARGVLTAKLALAVWGHDLVYDPRAVDNEERSAESFDVWLAGQGADDDVRSDVRRLILATRHAVQPSRRDEALLVDADLAILGSDRVAFSIYDDAIRREYAHVPALAYRVGRFQVLKGFLDLQQIFTTAEFAPLEAPARGNLRQALRKLAFLPF